MDKILRIEHTINIVRGSWKIVLCGGVFDLLHPGHIKHLESAKAMGNLLVVLITPDEYVQKGPGRPVFKARLRAEAVAALECVDYVTINKWPTAVEAIKILKPDIYVKGHEYRDAEDITGEIENERKAVKEVGGELRFTEEETFSSTKLVNEHFCPYPEEAEEYLKEFKKKHSADEIITSLQKLKKMTALVIGDVIVDEYHYVESIGKSPKDNIITTKFLSKEVFAGGVLAAANHLAGFVDKVHLITCFGRMSRPDDSNDTDIFLHECMKPNVIRHTVGREDAPTTVKRRYVDHAFLSKIFEVAFINDLPISEKVERKLCEALEGPQEDLTLVADFGHGLMTKNLRDYVSRNAHFLAVNTQTNSSNLGFNMITKYPKVYYACLDELELRLAFHQKYEDIHELMRHSNIPKLTVTTGHKGSITWEYPNYIYDTPALAKGFVDRTGAGDAYFAVTAPCVAAGMSMDVVGFIGNAAAALKLQIVGNKGSVEPMPLYKFITALLK